MTDKTHFVRSLVAPQFTELAVQKKEKVKGKETERKVGIGEIGSLHAVNESDGSLRIFYTAKYQDATEEVLHKFATREHVMWFCPTMLMWLGDRYGFKLIEQKFCSRRWWEKMLLLPKQIKHTTINLAFQKS